MKGAALLVTDVCWSPGRSMPNVLHPLSFSLEAGRVLGIAGPNGAGKTTLLRLLYRFHRPTQGQIEIDGRDIWSIPAQTVARTVAAVLQEQPSDFALTVREIVMLGRTPHRRSEARAKDAEIVEEALETLDLSRFAHRHLWTLSGGERQRVMVARALAQEPRLLVLDEPTNHLDIRHQLEILDIIRNLPLTIVTSLHDLNLAADVCDDILLLQSGHSVGFGAPAHVLSETAIAEAFQVAVHRDQLSLSGRDHLTFRLKDKELIG